MVKPKLFLVIAGCFISWYSFSQNVNPFNGSLNYDVPLLLVPSEAGNAVPISLMYGGNGINVEQPGSEVGLGWSLSAGGSIVRNVNGIPDDLSRIMFNQSAKTFSLQTGSLLGPTGLDVLSSKRNLDSLEFYYPNYDRYNVSGPGIAGSMTPMIFNYVAFAKDDNGLSFDVNNSPSWVLPKFVFDGDFADTLISRHYPSTPAYAGTPFKMPLDNISGACYNDATPYYGKKVTASGSPCNENYDPATHRLATPNFVEYTLDPAGVLGITSFTVTNSAGFVYKYTLPVYSNYSINYTYPLTNDYLMLDYTSSFNPEVKSSTVTPYYYVEHSYPGGATYVIENKDVNKVAKEWKLTSVTGPDYVDANTNGVIDAADKGYWVVFDYKLWSNDFTSRYPAFGFNYYFGSDPKTENFAMTDPKKISGKFATASLVNEELYYLNSISTSTHKAIFVRDVRMDEAGSNPGYDYGLHDSLTINQTGGDVYSWHGNIFDEGGPSASYNGNTTSPSYVKTVQLGKVDKLTFNFKQFDLNVSSTGLYDKLHIFAGPNTSSPEITLSNGVTNYPSPYTNAASIPGINVEVVIPDYYATYGATAITFQIEKKQSSPPGYIIKPGFNIEWHANGKRTPQLCLKRVLLYNNDYTSGPYFPAATALTIPNSTPYNRFSLASTTNASAPPYNETWYQANLSSLKNSSLKGVILNYDYSLANNYFKNINCEPYYKLTRLTSPSDVLSNLAVNSFSAGTGKLTLNKVISTEYQGNQLVPSYKFDYNQSISADNPNYNPIKVDTWGFYKSDASALGYYSYTTGGSMDYTDAWSLRTIVKPYGGTTEIQYESNSYETVSDGNGGYRPVSKIFPIKSISTDYSGSLAINLEEGTNYNDDLAQVYNISGINQADVFIPVNHYPTVSGPVSGVDLSNYFGAMTFNFNPYTPLPIIVTSIAKVSNNADVSFPYFSSCINNGASDFLNVNPIDLNGYGYTGNGWVRFTSDFAFGGGVRVKKIINYNGNDSYPVWYMYQSGVALNEADRFANPKYRYMKHSSCAMPDKLQAGGGDKFEMAPVIGYKKVTIRNMGQLDSEQGKIEMSFNTSGMYYDDNVIVSGNDDNYQVNVSNKTTFTATSGVCTRTDTGYVVEYIDRFSAFWGLLKEQKVYDVNENIISRNVMDYQTTDQGAVVENFAFAIQVSPYTSSGPCSGFSSRNRLYQTCIKRDYPAVLKRSVTYGQGTRTIKEPLFRDEITGEELVTRISGDNFTTALSVKAHAFRFSPFTDMGPKSVNASYKNILGADAYNYMSVDSNLTVPTGSASINFSGANASVFTKNALIRGYDLSTNTYTNTSSTTRNWYNNQSFAWVGSQGSLDKYGLYKKSELAANPFNFSSPASSSNKWRSTGEISLIDDKNHKLETRTFNNRFSAVKFDFTSKYRIAEVTNCNYKSFTYSSFEYPNGLGMTDGEVTMPTSYCYVSNAVGGHSGNSAALVNAGGTGPNYGVSYDGTGSYGEELGLQRDRIYRASVWVHNSSASGAKIVLELDGSIGGVPSNQKTTAFITDPTNITIGNWTLMSVDIQVPYNYTSTGGTSNKLKTYLQVQGSGTAYFDDLILRPVESTFSGRVQDYETGRVTHEIDADGYITKYVYDYAGNVIDTYKELPYMGLKLIKHKTYNYARGSND